MFTIGDFARHGRVSVRMLRHYDAIGLIRPAHVDQPTGYRFYEANQLAALNRVVALKDLGFTLAEVSSIIDEQVSAEQLRGMLRLRRAELQAEIAAGTARLAGVEARLRIIESEGHMPTTDVVVKRIPPVRVAELTAIAAGYQPADISPVISPLYDDLIARLGQAQVPIVGAPIAYYEDSPAGDGSVIVHATITVAAEPDETYGFAIVDLPELPNAATIVHKGAMDDVVPTGQALAQWIDANGYRSLGYARELYLACPPGDFDQWVTELQEPITAV